MPLAAGGMARIYIARTTGIGSFERHVVLKCITPERERDITAVQMFLDEARLAAALNHQNVAQVFEVGEDNSIHYLAMEYVHGQDLRSLLAKAGSQGTRVPLELALTTVAGAAAGLNHAHERRGPDGVPLGIVHRDVSPSNIMIGYDGSVKLLDFGIAKATARSVETQSGIIKGKFAYMAPEQCRGRDVDRRSDVFSLGIILYEISTQHRCFRADSDFDTMHRIVTGDVVRPTRIVPNYPAALEAIVMKALAVDANQRYQSAGLLLEALEAFAAANRMSLSTMALGRFMREMFGDQSEPWLTSAGRLTSMLQPKESTISNTDGGSTGSLSRELAPTTALPAVSPGTGSSAALELPKDVAPEQPEPPNAYEWNAKSYPTVGPAFVQAALGGPMPVGGPEPQRPSPMPIAHASPSSSGATGPVMAIPAGPTPVPVGHGLMPSGAMGSVPTLPGMPGVPASALHGGSVGTATGPAAAMPSGPIGAMAMGPSAPIPVTDRSGVGITPPAMQAVPMGSQPISVANNPFGANPGSGSGSAPAHLGMGSNAYGHVPTASRADNAYPADLELRPNRRPLYIGLGIVAVALIAFLAFRNGGSSAKVVTPGDTVLDARTSDPVGGPSEDPGSGSSATNPTTPDKTTPVPATPDKTTPVPATPDKTPPDKTPPDKATPDKTPPDKATPDKTPPDKATPDKTTPDKTPPDKTTPDKTPPDKATPTKVGPDKATPTKVTPDKTTPDKTKPDKTTPDKTTPDKTTPDKTKPDKPKLPKKPKCQNPGTFDPYLKDAAGKVIPACG